jgi:hypothetical protein
MSSSSIKTTTKTEKKIGINTLISWGASVVIIGLTFKLLHWEWGEWLIGVGLFTEALLFFILGFTAMTSKDDTDAGVRKTTYDSNLDNLLNTHISPATIERLGRGFDQFNKTVEAVNMATGYAGATQNMMNEVENATIEIKELSKNLAQLNTIYRAQLEAFRKN